MVFNIADILIQWESVGIFDYLLPFLLIFAILYGILTSLKILGENKGIHTIISLVIALLALRLEFVPTFFREIFPRLGVGLSVIMVILILVGIFIPNEERRYWAWGLGAIAFVIAIVVVARSFDVAGWASSAGINAGEYVGWIAGAILIIGIIIAVAVSGGESSGSSGPKLHEGGTFPGWKG